MCLFGLAFVGQTMLLSPLVQLGRMPSAMPRGWWRLMTQMLWLLEVLKPLYAALVWLDLPPHVRYRQAIMTHLRLRHVHGTKVVTAL